MHIVHRRAAGLDISKRCEPSLRAVGLEPAGDAGQPKSPQSSPGRKNDVSGAAWRPSPAHTGVSGPRLCRRRRSVSGGT